MSTFLVVIHHNPDCGTSRNVLEIIHAAGYEPTVIDYLKEGWTRTHLLALGVNPVSAYLRDHIFVPESRAEEALCDRTGQQEWSRHLSLDGRGADRGLAATAPESDHHGV